jgi:hypothetical protein
MMQIKPYPFLACGLLILAILACNLGAPAPTPEGQGANILTLAAQTLQAQTPTANPGISVEAVLTLAVETLQAQATPTSTIVPSIPPTNKPKKTKTPKPSDTPVSSTSIKVPGTFVFHPPIINVTLDGSVQAVPVKPTLDTTHGPTFGGDDISVGFSPDPDWTYMGGTGGTVDVSYLGGGCSGFAAAPDDHRIKLTGGGINLLRIYFIGLNGDPAMVVKDPYGNFYCADNSFGTVSPTIDFSNPAEGTYFVWIARDAASISIRGTLYITDKSRNHP